MPIRPLRGRVTRRPIVEAQSGFGSCAISRTIRMAAAAPWVRPQPSKPVANRTWPSESGSRPTNAIGLNGR